MTDRDTRNHILQTTIALLDQEDEPGAITVRRIATYAHVGVGAINYHFPSKDHLLHEAIQALLTLEAGKSFPDDGGQPRERVRAALRQRSRLGRRYPKLLSWLARFELAQGEFATANSLVPLLRAVAEKASDADIRLAALQLETMLQLLLLRGEAVGIFLGVDTTEQGYRERVLDALVDSVCEQLWPEQKGPSQGTDRIV